MARRRSTIKGAASFRRMLRRLPDTTRDELANFLAEAGPVLQGTMQGFLPSRTGRLRAAITYKLARKTLNLRIGLVTKATARQFFYGHILDVGRKAGEKIVRGRTYRWGRIAPERAEFKTRQLFRSRFLPEYGKVMDRALLKAAQGAGDD